MRGRGDRHWRHSDLNVTVQLPLHYLQHALARSAERRQYRATVAIVEEIPHDLGEEFVREGAETVHREWARWQCGLAEAEKPVFGVDE